MAKRPILKTVAAVIKAFGGNVAIAEWTGTSTSHVRLWRRWGFIPPGWHWRMERELRARGFEVSPVVFGVDIKAPRHSQKTGGVHA